MRQNTIRFLRDLVSRQQIRADDPEIVEIATLIRDVVRELDAALSESEAQSG